MVTLAAEEPLKLQRRVPNELLGRVASVDWSRLGGARAPIRVPESAALAEPARVY
jgi:hypothetical protein